MRIEMPRHYVYLIQIGDVYKIGRTEVNEGLQFNRFRAYPPNSNLVLMRRVDGHHVERQIIQKFSNKFEKVGASLEYFRGDVNLMVQIVYDLTSGFHVDTTSDRNFRINTRGELTRKDCDELRNELGCLPFGDSNFYWKNSNGTEDKIKSIYRHHVFSTVIWTRKGTPLRRLVEFVKILEAKKFRVLSTEGFTWIDDKLALCEELPRAVWNSVDHFLESSARVKKGQDLFIPLDVVTAIYTDFCENVYMNTEDFEQHCGLRIERIEGDIMWAPDGFKPIENAFRGQLVVRGINVHSMPDDVFDEMFLKKFR
jgi:hypothetical protein